MKAAAVLAALVLAAPLAARAAPPPIYKVTAGYDGTLLVKVLDIELEQAVSAAGFTAQARMKSHGVLSLFKRLDVKATSRGRLADGQATPGQFAHVNLDRVANRQVEVRWAGDDVAATARPSYPSPGSPAPTRAQKLSAVDPLTLMVRLALTQDDRPCGGGQTLFDGRQLYALDLSAPRPRPATARETALGLTGPVRCQLTFREVAGFDAKPPARRNQGLAAPLSIDFARVGPQGPWILVSARGRTPLGEAVIEIKSLDAQGATAAQIVASSQ